MFVLFWATLLFCVSGSNADTGTSRQCNGEYCITLSDGLLTAEAGLCVVIPCSFQTAYGFTPQNLVWYKCKQYRRCYNDDNIIFDSNNKNHQSEFQGRVSLLEPDVRQNNCSIIINDLRESDSGSYQLRVNGKHDGFTFPARATVFIGGLTQKPRIKIPPMTEGQQATLTCIAPGLCSGSIPEVSWTWRGAGGTESYITGNSTSFRTKSQTAFSQRHIATLTFNSSAEHHNTNITCKIRFTGEKTTEASSTLKVNYVKEVKLTGGTNVNEGETLNLTCSVESFPPSLIMWSKLGSNITLYNDTGSATLFIINATTEHSGQYVCTAKHMNNTPKENINITVIYKRTLQITGNTTVKEGDVLNLICSIESFPPALIVWSALSSKTDLQNGTYTDLNNDTGSATLVIHNVTAEHSGQYICTAKHLDTNMTLFTDVTVTYIRKPQIIGNTIIKERDVLNLTCSVESFPPALIMWKALSANTNLHSGIYTAQHSDNGSATLVIHNVTVEHSGQYICTAKHLDTTMTLFTDVTVTYIRKPQIIGNTIIKEGDVLNLTCSVESFPPALIMWKALSANTNLHSGTYTAQHSDNGSATLVIHNVTVEHSGQYICTAKHLDTTMTLFTDVTVTWFSKIHDGSGCVLQAEVLTCVCICEGFPLPTIKWPLLKNHNEYSVITTVTNHTVNSTVSLTVKKHGNSSVECVSNNGNGEAKENLLIHNLPKKAVQPSVLMLKYLEIIIAFFIGVVLTAAVCCLTKKCLRKKQKSSGNLDETMEMVTSQDHPQIYDDHTLQDNQTHPEEEAEDGGVAAEKEGPESSSTPKEVEYANIDFSLLKIKSVRESARTQDSTKTVYAEIKKAVKEEKEDDNGEEGETVESKEEEVRMEEDSKQCEPDKEEGEDEAVYSTVNDLKDKI
ncbi:sialic acid-binding Ig-like lectin 10 isoform X1 [Archocentrus centrarchus]|uniref:sialic acid-binding Ig-like lectin 10 isoform X1 n=1 Tax=Archocentrus centrarchus TaxID=63155 RepID=UPI0011E9EA0A|nr:sialic acid-binding Ig-like lectin 10 isoform X1 [Archocentrus centrarchus]